jgi:uncharacterized protein
VTSFEIESREGLPIRGNVHAPQSARAMVVIAHGFKGFKDWGFFPWLAQHLCNVHRFIVCRFNMSRSGIGDDPESFDRLDLFADDTYSTQISDLVAVIRLMQTRFRDVPTFILGHSRGGGVAVLAAQELRDIHGLVTWSAISTVDRWDDATKKKWRADGHLDAFNTRTKQTMPTSTRLLDEYEANRERFDILGAAARLKVPLLVIHGGSDESVPVEEGRALAAHAADASLLIIGGASHTYGAIHPLVNVTPALTLATEVSAHFIAAYD